MQSASPPTCAEATSVRGVGVSSSLRTMQAVRVETLYSFVARTRGSAELGSSRRGA